ncbi:hypothetical protein PHMEG_0009413 [Phytophthora megakarya]|uniref:Uncharacterized protein n=1 Tax=Phytophthora megakarya TaxID=4795 RepID=A0A225WHP1_9STRA|nr:hypothetical protein PHMEG_0009413 [Phytophthora megakarya]
MEVLSLLPNEFWGGSIRIAEEFFSVEYVEVNLRRVFLDRSKKEKKPPTVVNVVKTFTRKKRTQAESSETRSCDCFFFFKDGHWKKRLSDDGCRSRFGGKLFHSNLRTAPGTKKKCAITLNKGSKSTIRKLAADNLLEDERKEADEFEFKERVPPSERSKNEVLMNPMDVDDEGLAMG